MRIFIDSAELSDINLYADDPAITGFTTNATLVRKAGADVRELVGAAAPKEISVEYNWDHYAENVRWKITSRDQITDAYPVSGARFNYTAVCSPQQIPAFLMPEDIISVFAGRIMDTGRSPEHVLTLAKRTGAQVLWASSRSVYDITLAEQHGCDIITVTPAIYEKYREWHGMPLEEVAARTIAQFEEDRAWTS